MISRQGPVPRGLTLLELVIALVIAALLLSISAPSFASWLARHRVRAVAQHMAADMGEARHEAVRRGRTLHMVYRTGSDWCYAIALDPQADCRQAGSSVLKSVSAKSHPGVAIEAGTPQAFDGRNGVRHGASGGAHLVSSRGDQLAVRLSTLGRPTVCAPVAGWSDLPRC